MNNEIEVVKEQAGQMTPVQRITELKERKSIIGSVMKEVMKENEHFGKIPGTNKQTLLKSGAECLTSVFGLAPRFTIKQDEFDNGHREYIITCELYAANGNFLGSGVGSCSTFEKKYRYRNIKGVQKDNPDIADQYNTVLKMAKKRALVDATLTVTGASDIFTQDVEDFTEEHSEPAKWAMDWSKFVNEKWNFLGTMKASDKVKYFIESYSMTPDYKDISAALQDIWLSVIKGKELNEAEKAASDNIVSCIIAGKLQ